MTEAFSSTTNLTSHTPFSPEFMTDVSCYLIPTTVLYSDNKFRHCTGGGAYIACWQGFDWPTIFLSFAHNGWVSVQERVGVSSRSGRPRQRQKFWNLLQ